MTAWRRLLPETRDPRDAPWQRDDGWLVKSAMSNTGDDVSMRELLPQLLAPGAMVGAPEPSRWVAQRRFDAVAIPPVGLRRVCLGVYAINAGQRASTREFRRVVDRLFGRGRGNTGGER
jgi:hypothetical protein